MANLGNKDVFEDSNQLNVLHICNVFPCEAIKNIFSVTFPLLNLHAFQTSKLYDSLHFIHQHIAFSKSFLLFCFFAYGKSCVFQTGLLKPFSLKS